MIVVRVELWSAVTGKCTELARMNICNDGERTLENPRFGSYIVRTLRGRSSAELDRATVQRTTRVENWPRAALHIWNLVAEALKGMQYGRQPK